jgi:hypothetical protein
MDFLLGRSASPQPWTVMFQPAAGNQVIEPSSHSLQLWEQHSAGFCDDSYWIFVTAT